MLLTRGALILVMASLGTLQAQVGPVYYVAPAPAGSDSLGDGTPERPWATISFAITGLPETGGTVMVRDGLYQGNVRVSRKFSSLAWIRAEHPYQARLRSDDTQTLSIWDAANVVFTGFDVAKGKYPTEAPLCVQIASSESIALIDNILHDCHNNDVLKIDAGARRILVLGNVLYNQQGSAGQHIEIDGAADVTIRDNIFFNDYNGSPYDGMDTQGFVIAINSGGAPEARRLHITSNIFLNWVGAPDASFLQIGEDGQQYQDALIENNLLIGTSPVRMRSPLTAMGVRELVFRHNTIAGDMRSSAYAMRLAVAGSGIGNLNLAFRNNIWADFTGRMSSFAEGLRADNAGVVLDNNLYWNGGQPIPAGPLPEQDAVQYTQDPHPILEDPLLRPVGPLLLPRWTGMRFPSGMVTIREEFERLVRQQGTPEGASPAIGRADPENSPATDVLNCARGSRPDVGAVQVGAPSVPLRLVPVPARVVGGTETTLNLVVLDGPASQALTIFLSSSDPDVSLPPSVALQPGMTAAAFTLRTSPVTAATQVRITAELDGASTAAELSLMPRQTGEPDSTGGSPGGSTGTGGTGGTNPQPAGAIKVEPVTEKTTTQVILRYIAPDLNPCAVEVSENPDFMPPVPDIDPQIFSGAASDFRPANIRGGRGRIFMVGKRTAEKGDVSGLPRSRYGFYVSRALQADTLHYYRITCPGVDPVAGTFQTANLPWGHTYPLVYPADPKKPGEYAWPNLNLVAGTNEKLIDPQTGIQLVRITGPRSFLPGDATGLPVLTRGVFDDSADANWTINWPDTFPAEWAGDGVRQPKLYVVMDPSAVSGPSSFNAGWGDTRQLDYIQVRLTGSATASGEDGKVQVCLTLNGVNCAPNTTITEQDLSGCDKECTVGTAAPGHWSGGAPQAFSGSDLARRTTTAAYDGATGELTWTGGDYFPPHLVPGSRVWIGGVPYKLSAAGGPQSITIVPGLGLSRVSVVGEAFGVLIWKKTPSSHRVQLTGVKFNVGWSYGFGAWSGGQPRHCHPVKVQHSGRDGYHCVLPGPSSVLAWVDAESGYANLLGHLYAPAGSGYSAGALYAGTGAPFDTTDPNVLYGVLSGSNGSRVVKCVYSGDNSPKTSNSFRFGAPPDGWACSSLTADPYNLESLIQSFDSRYAPSSFRCVVASVQNGKLHLNCASGQDTEPGGWAVIYDPSVTPGPGANPVMAALPTSGVGAPNPTPARWCTMHGMLDAGEGTDWQLFTLNHTGGGSGFRTTLNMPGGLDAGTTALMLSASPAVDALRPGDVIRIDSERMRVTGVTAPNRITVERGYRSTNAASHVASATVTPLCAAQEATGGGSVWWDPINDPHGHNAGGKTVVADAPFNGGHRVYRSGRYVGVTNGPACAGVATECLRVRDGNIATTVGTPPTAFISINLAFAGAKAAPYVFESHVTADNGMTSAPQYVLDYRQLVGRGFSTAFTQVSEALYKMSKGLDRKRVPTFAFCGSKPLVDISGPSSSITGVASDSYKYCVALKEGECREGSSAGEIYFNCPRLTYTKGCLNGEKESNGETVADACIHDAQAQGGILQQIRVDGGSDPDGSGTRLLTSAFARYRRQPSLDRSNGKALPGGEFALMLGRWVDDQRSDIYTVKLPPLPGDDGVNRGTFVPILVPSGAVPSGTDNVIVEFGYDPDFHCASRQEACVANSAAVDEAAPFYWASETYSGLACPGECTVAIPAISQRVVYYRFHYRAADGNTILTAPTSVAVSR